MNSQGCQQITSGIPKDMWSNTVTVSDKIKKEKMDLQKIRNENNHHQYHSQVNDTNLEGHSTSCVMVVKISYVILCSLLSPIETKQQLEGLFFGTK